MAEGYDVTAQFYDILAADGRTAVLDELGPLLSAQVIEGPIADIGAGTGLATRAIARAVPQVPILALEPHPVMRASLMTRICDDPDLRARTTVLPVPVLEARLPTLGAVVLAASIHHFSPTERGQLLAALSDALFPGGRVLIEIQCASSEDIAETPFAKAKLGEVSYQGWMSARRLDDDRQSWRMQYAAARDDAEIERQTADYVCWVLSAADLISAASEYGFSGRIAGAWVELAASKGRSSAA